MQHTELVARVRELEEKVQALEARQKDDTLQTSKSVNELHDALQMEQIAREILEERKSKELRKIESAITLDINFERKGRMEDETRILKQLDERCLALSLELGAHTYGAQQSTPAEHGADPGVDRVVQVPRRERWRDCNVDREAFQYEEEDICATCLKVLDKEREARHVFEKQVLAKVDLETQQLLRLIDMERTVREEATMNMIAMIEKTRHRMQNDMSQARAEREAAEDTILRILEQTTSGQLNGKPAA